MAGSTQAAVGTTVQNGMDNAINGFSQTMDDMDADSISTGEAAKRAMLYTGRIAFAKQLVEADEKQNKNG